MTILIIVASIIGLTAMGGTIYLLVQSYNHLMATRIAVDQYFANIDVFLKQRADEIPELVKILKASAQYESAKISQLMRAYEDYQHSHDMKDKLMANQRMELALKLLPSVASQPDYKGLQQRLTEIETQLAQRRESFNDRVATLNALILRIPYILLAGMLNLQACPYLEISDAEKTYHGVDL